MKQRPSDILGIEGSHLERLLWDLAITANVKIAVETTGIVKRGPQSVKDKIREKRRRLGVTSYIT